MHYNYHNHQPFYEDTLTHQLLLQNQYQQNLISKTSSFLSTKYFPIASFIFLIDLLAPAIDYKNSLRGVTVPQPMPQVVVETSQ